MHTLPRIILFLLSMNLFTAGFLYTNEPYHNFVTIEEAADQNSLKITTIYGTVTLDKQADAVFIELIESLAMQRLKDINQLGIYDKYSHRANFNRFDHSIGVWLLIRLNNGSIAEQLAGLLHDVSHTVFSHVGAFCFVTDYKAMDAFQDNEHEQYLHDSGIAAILTTYGFTVEDIHHKKSSFTILERDLPDLCADRIEYNLQGGIKEELITYEQAKFIVRHLTYADGVWFFTNVDAARMFAQLPLIMTRTIWGSVESTLTGQWLGQAMRKGIELRLFNRDDIRFGTDAVVWDRMEQSGDQEIGTCLHKIKNVHNFFTLNEQTYDAHIPSKFRGVDPLVQTEDGSLKRLTELDSAYAGDYQSIKGLAQQGWHVMYTRGSVDTPKPHYYENFMQTFEIEMRYEILNQQELEQFVASLQKVSCKQDVDVYFDNPNLTLYESGIFIRTRNDKQLDIKFNRACLEDRSLPLQDYCEEYSFALPLQEADLPQLNALLQSLSLQPTHIATLDSVMMANTFAPHYVIDKTRTTYKYNRFTLCKDDIVDLGSFLEIELVAPSIEDLEVIKKEMQLLLHDLSLEQLKTCGYATMLLRKRDFQEYLRGRFTLPEDLVYKQQSAQLE